LGILSLAEDDWEIPKTFGISLILGNFLKNFEVGCIVRAFGPT
jgi:hypothetical protein